MKSSLVIISIFALLTPLTPIAAGKVSTRINFQFSTEDIQRGDLKLSRDLDGLVPGAEYKLYCSTHGFQTPPPVVVELIPTISSSTLAIVPPNRGATIIIRPKYKVAVIQASLTSKTNKNPVEINCRLDQA